MLIEIIFQSGIYFENFLCETINFLIIESGSTSFNIMSTANYKAFNKIDLKLFEN